MSPATYPDQNTVQPIQRPLRDRSHVEGALGGGELIDGR